jgi:hypothetical protein
MILFGICVSIALYQYQFLFGVTSIYTRACSVTFLPCFRSCDYIQLITNIVRLELLVYITI